MPRHWKIAICAIGALMLLSSAGCAGTLFKNYGSIVPDGRVTNAFDKYQINPNYNYYYSGSEVYPSAIIGLDKAYSLDSDLWKKVDMTPAKLRELVTYMKDKATTVNFKGPLHGFAMLDDKGKEIGVWYSILEAKTSLKMKDNQTVIIVTPDIDAWLRFEGGSRLHVK
jgi:hypothetical protein